MNSDPADVDTLFDAKNFHPNKALAAKVTLTKMKKKGKKVIKQTHQKKMQIEGIIVWLDTHLGATASVSQDLFILDAATTWFR
jgi:hypothetical protein